MHGEKLLLSFAHQARYELVKLLLELALDEVLARFDRIDHLDVNLRICVSHGVQFEGQSADRHPKNVCPRQINSANPNASNADMKSRRDGLCIEQRTQSPQFL